MVTPYPSRTGAGARCERGEQRRIRVVIGSLQVGGTETHLAQILPGLMALGWTPRVVTVLGLGPVAQRLRDEHIAVRELASARRMQGWARWRRRTVGLALLVADLQRELQAGPDELTWMLLPHAYLLTMAGAALARYRGPLVMSRRSLNRYQQHYPGLRALERVLHPHLSAVLANSRAVRVELQRDEGVAPQRIALIHNGIDCRRFQQAASRARMRSALGIADDALVLCTLANLIAYKGHGDLLRALAPVRDRLPTWRMLCVGQGDSGALTAECMRLGLSGHVIWLGGRHDVPELLGACDIGVLASHEEGFSNAVLESMAAGLPMIATRVGGNPDAVIDGETGILVPPHDPLALGEAIVHLAADRDLARRMGDAARDRVAHRFSLERCVADYDRLFRAVIERRSLPADLVVDDRSRC